ncbi:hypothetical protein [Geminocystis sp. NIES-3709]|uniref:hypothetical protein n=1 Tax=Geminocystis sp. NIES-3709 TaxID=1617448 RepID=UPI0005FCD91C|nr:hypothetical protein [Geminocystis sp. NIES-3709]BAQ66503.1 myosin heavy chain [Geminocystis sp. NIES-3709]
MTRVNSKSTKAEILAAYQELEQEKTNLEKQVNLAQKQAQVQQKALENAQTIVANSSVQPPVKAPVKPPENSPVKSMNNIEQIIHSLEQLQIGFGSAVSQLSEQLITEASSLEKLEGDIQGEINQLEELHSLDTIEEDTLVNLLATYEESQKTFFDEYNQRHETLGEELENLKKDWLKEQENKQREIKQRNEVYGKNKQRENEEYQYNLQLTRQLDRENYEQELNQLYKDLEEGKKQQEKIWEEREKTISEKEKEYAEAKQKVAEFETKLENEIKKAKEEGKGIGNYQAKIKADLRQKEINGESQNYQLRIQALESTILSNENRINSLSQQLDSALKQVQDLAIKAIEGTSNRNSFEAMKEVALEQAKNQQKGK